METRGHLVKEWSLDGYPPLTKFIASDHDRTTLVFKRFDSLVVRNLLYLQSELAELQARQGAFDLEDYSVTADIDAKVCAMSWENSKKLAALGNPGQLERVKFAREIRDAIKEYRQLLVFICFFDA
jgi:hypothetical protein